METYQNIRTFSPVDKTKNISFYPKFETENEEQQFIKQLENDGHIPEIETKENKQIIHYNVSNEYFSNIWEQYGWNKATAFNIPKRYTWML